MQTYLSTRQAAAALVLAILSSSTLAQVRVTEFMSEGQGLTGPGSGANRQREFFELTNLGQVAVDVSAWTYNDNNTNDPHNFGLSFGALAAGESVVLTQMGIADFRSHWGLPATVRVFSYGQLSNLGNADTINIYRSSVQDATTLVDSLSYTADLRGSGVSRNRPVGGSGASTNADWVGSAIGDAYGSRFSPNPAFPAGPEYVDLANPGAYPVPEPGTWLMMGAGLAALGLARRSRRR